METPSKFRLTCLSMSLYLDWYTRNNYDIEKVTQAAKTDTPHKLSHASRLEIYFSCNLGNLAHLSAKQNIIQSKYE